MLEIKVVMLTLFFCGVVLAVGCLIVEYTSPVKLVRKYWAKRKEDSG